MSRVFLSHAGADSQSALALKRWLTTQRPDLADEIFLDVDLESGMRLGERWKSQLFRNNSRCEVVICLVSQSWATSHECKTEYRTAETLGKRILCARLVDVGDGDITSEWQRCDLFAQGAQTHVPMPDEASVRFNTSALEQLLRAIDGTGVGPDTFAWPPPEDPRRAPFRGWEPFEDIDAGVFFGRDSAIVRGLDELRSMRQSGVKSLFVVLGPSGSGKSSFLRAGLLPRVKREDRSFLVLGVLRPERHALTGENGFAAAIHSARMAMGLRGMPLGELRNLCLSEPNRVAEVFELLRLAAGERLANASQPGSEPTLVLPVDQAEELFAADAGSEADQFLALLTHVLRRVNATGIGLLVAATIRTDRYEAMQNHPALDGLTTTLFDELKPMPSAQFTEVITGPARRSRQSDRQVEFAPDLVERLLADASEGADTLPLLSLTLARLYTEWTNPGDGRLTLAEYEAMGGMHDVVNNEIEQILPSEADQRESALAALRSAFVPWLATINRDGDQPVRRVARYADLPGASLPLIDALVAKRLMVKDTRAGDVVVEVALESLLRQWNDLAGWLREERQNLIAADDLERNAVAWQAHGQDEAWLLTGSRLTDGETLSRTAGFSARLADVQDYVHASRESADAEEAAEEARRQADLRQAQERRQLAEDHAATLRRRSRILVTVLTVTALIAGIAVFSFVQANHATERADTTARQATAARIVYEANDILARNRPGGDIQAFQMLLAAHDLVEGAADAGLRDGLAKRLTTAKIIDTASLISPVAFSPDGRRLATGVDDTVQLWDSATGRRMGVPIAGHTSTVWSVAFSPDGRKLASASEDETVRLWDAETGRPIGQPLKGNASAVASVVFSPDGHQIAAAIGDTVQLWNTETGRPVGALTGPTAKVNAVAFSPDGRRLAAAVGDDTVRLWDTNTLEPIGNPLIGHTNVVSCVAFSPDGRLLASGGYDNTIRFWNADSGESIGPPLTGHTGSVQSLAFSPDGRRLATASGDTTVRLWDVDTRQPIGAPLAGHTNVVSAVAFSPDGHRLASGSFDRTVRLWNTDSGQPVFGDTDEIRGVELTRDGSRMASFGVLRTLKLWDMATGQPLAVRLAGQPSQVYSLDFSPDGRRVAIGDAGRLRVWDVETGQPIGVPITRHVENVRDVAISPDGRSIAVADNELVWRWDVETGRQLGGPLTGNTAWVTSVVFSPDGSRIASGGFDRAVRLWDAHSGAQLGAPLAGHSDAVIEVVFSPDGRRLASASADGTVRLWDADTGRQTGAPLSGHDKTVSTVAFSPDGQLLASGGVDGTVRLWNVDTGQQIGAALTGHNSSIASVAFTADGRRVVSASGDATARIWPAIATPDMLCDKLTTNMSQRQWRDWVSDDPAIGYRELCPGLPVIS